MDYSLDNLGGNKGCQGFKASEAHYKFWRDQGGGDESFDEFYVKLKDIVNSTFNLGETIPEPKIVRRSLPKRFHAKITCWFLDPLKQLD